MTGRWLRGISCEGGLFALGGCSPSNHGCLQPRCSGLSWKERERREKLLLKAGSLPGVPGECEGSAPRQKGGRENRRRVQDGGGETSGHRVLSNSSGQGGMDRRAAPHSLSI